MDQGTVEQIGTPTEIYYSPRTPFVANFVGKMNFMKASLAGAGSLRIGDTVFDLARSAGDFSGRDFSGSDVLACVRPEHVRRVQSGGLPATVSHVEFLGSCWRATLRVPALAVSELLADIVGDAGFAAPVVAGDSIQVEIPSERLIVFPSPPDGAVPDHVSMA
jgi:iron(III) transport system ATP-binding protein